MSTLTVGTIAEKVTDAGVAVDGVTLKDGGATLTSDLTMSDNDRIKLGTGTDLQIYHDGTDSLITNATNSLKLDSNAGTSIKIDAFGHVTKPLQPAFLARVASTQANLPINTDTTVVFGTEVFDQNGDFDTSTSTFTAPETGRYQFNVNTRMGSLDTATFFYETKIITSNFEFRDIFDPRQLNGDLGVFHSSFAIFCDMDANDTCIIKIKPHNSGTAQADINTNHCNFSGYLVC